MYGAYGREVGLFVGRSMEEFHIRARMYALEGFAWLIAVKVLLFLISPHLYIGRISRVLEMALKRDMDRLYNKQLTPALERNNLTGEIT